MNLQLSLTEGQFNKQLHVGIIQAASERTDKGLFFCMLCFLSVRKILKNLSKHKTGVV